MSSDFFWLHYVLACLGTLFYVALSRRAMTDVEAKPLLQSTRLAYRITHAVLTASMFIASISLLIPPFLVLSEWWQALAIVLTTFTPGYLLAKRAVAKVERELDGTAFYLGAGPTIAMMVLLFCVWTWRPVAVAAGWLAE